MFESKYAPIGVINAYIVTGQIEVVINDDQGRPYRCAVQLQPGKMQTNLSGHTVTVDWASVDEMRVQIGKKYDLKLTRQPKGHYFAPLHAAAEKRERVDPVEAFKQLQAARKASK